MSYTAEMRESIKKVETSRARRMEETHRRLTLEEQQKLLDSGTITDPGEALVLVERAIKRTQNQYKDARAWTKSNIRLRRGPASRVRYDGNARAAGRAAGHRARLTRPAGQLTG